MVDPISLASLAAFALSKLLDAQSENQYFDQQQQFLVQRFQQNRALALDAHYHAVQDLNQRVAENRLQITEEIRNLFGQSLTRRGTAVTTAAGKGVAGGSSTEVQLDLIRAEESTRGRLRTYQQQREADALSQRRALTLTTRGRILSALPGPIQQPNIFSQGLGILSSGTEGFLVGSQISKALG